MADASDPMARTGMLDILDTQRKAHLRDLPVSVSVRHDRLDRAIALLVDHADELTSAVIEDFGARSVHETRFMDIAASINALKFARKHVAGWMRPWRRQPEFPLGLLGAKARIEHQPLGVVGVVSPWNVPVNLTFAPLAGVLAAGNRCMIKPSEFTPATSAALGRLIGEYFSPEEISVVTGGADTGAEFCSLPFDHLLFTGATSVAKHVMRAAAENLVPVTLELGGKSPVIVGASANFDRAADSILTGKAVNAGQTCIAPDHVFVPKNHAAEFAKKIAASAEKMFPTMLENPGYAAIISSRHYERLENLVDDARGRGAEVISLAPQAENFAGARDSRKFPPTLILDPDPAAIAMQDEIFGPVLPVIAYENISEVVEAIATRPHPLALYYFGNDRGEQEQVLERTQSGGVTINDVMMHAAQEDLPFGGVGHSGTGAYHGREGFLRFSHARSVFTQSNLNVAEMAGLRPPYGKKLEKLIARTLKR